MNDDNQSNSEIKVHSNYIECTPAYLEEAKEYCRKYLGKYSHFCVRNGKAKYDILYLPDNSVGIYYALKMNHNGLSGKRALNPSDKIRIFSTGNLKYTTGILENSTDFSIDCPHCNKTNHVKILEHSKNRKYSCLECNKPYLVAQVLDSNGYPFGY